MVDPDRSLMRRAIANAAAARLRSAPNPWVGAVVATSDGTVHDGSTHAPGGPHAEKAALASAGEHARGATLYSTLEPCSHHGRTGPCVDTIIEAGIARVVVGVEDPDPNVQGHGVARLRDAGIIVEVGVEAESVEDQLAAYLTHRRTGRPRVVLKLAMTLDGRIAAPDGSSQWITGPEARADGHRLRALSDAIVVGAGTVRADRPALTVRSFTPAAVDDETPHLDPWRIVLGSVGDHSTDAPFEEYSGSLPDLLDTLGSRGLLQVLVEGGAAVAGAFHRAGLVDEYWFYMAPALLGGDDGLAPFAGPGAPTMAEVERGRFRSIERLGADLRLVYEAAN